MIQIYSISIQNLNKNYGEVQALNSINMQINSPGIYGIVGANGAGKTTLLLILNQFIKKYSGIVEIIQKMSSNENVSIASANIHNKIGFLPEYYGFFPSLSAYEHVAFLYEARTGIKNNQSEIENMLNWVNLEKRYWRKNPKIFSKGMRQRLGIALAFIGTPPIITLDEPLANIDPLGRLDFLQKFKKFQETNHTILLISSHVIAEIEQIAEYIAILNKGKLLIMESLLQVSANANNLEYDIVNFDFNQDPLEKIYSIINDKKSVLDIKDVRRADGKLLVNTTNPFKLQDYVKSAEVTQQISNNFYLRPTSGFLSHLYAKLITEQV